MQNLDNSLEIQRRLYNYANNYNRWIYKNIKDYIGSRVLEVGCAIGNITQFLLNCELLVSIDIEEFYIDYVKSRFKDHLNFKALQFDIANERTVRELKSHYLDTVICINVLEHVENDTLALINMYNILQPRGKLILLVPAFSFLYGSMDRTDGHYRRYNCCDLLKKLKNSRFIISKSFYFNFLGFFGWYLNGRILNRTFLPIRQLSSFDRIVPLITRFESKFRIPFGQSLVVICERN